MTAKELFDAGDLAGAIGQLTQDVKAAPRDSRNRIFLFELLCFAGDFQRAERQLDAIAQTSGEVKVEMGVQVYRNALKADMARRAFFTEPKRQPKFLLEPPEYASLHVEAVNKLRENRFDELESLLEESNRVRGHAKGQRDGNPFADIKDGDDLLGPFLEVLWQQEYLWLPFEQIKKLEIQPPQTLRDLIWIPVKVEFGNNPIEEVFVPVQYHGSSEHQDDNIKLGRMTDWKTVGEETFVGLGQRMFSIDDVEYPILEIRKIELGT